MEIRFRGTTCSTSPVEWAGYTARSAPSELGERGNQARIAPLVLRRMEQTCFSSASDDEVGGLHGRDPRRASLASEAIKHS
jgi:hypothetical protein